MLAHEIIADDEEMSVRIYDAPANGWRILFVQRDGVIAKYTDKDKARDGIEIYDRSDKAALFDAEMNVYAESTQTGKALSQCGLSSLVRFGELKHFLYATFTLPEEFIRRSGLMVIGFKDQTTIYSAGWDVQN
ncbi:MAG: hypothetical protein JST85_18370 [Acidobacteria bacterium]|nr:hypothetical protein [Acidobacteriota bacterium]